MSHPLACRCGAVRGSVAPDPPFNHVVCYCRDCQAFAQFLGRAEEVLDAHGGSDIVQMRTKNLTLTQGADRLASIRLTPRGPLRWYTTCCNTPIGNTALTPRISFVGLITACLAKEPPVAASFGPVVMRGFTSGYRGEPKPPRGSLLTLIRRLVGITFPARLDGSWRRTPFFDAASGRPVAEPRTLDSDEHARLLAAVDA